MVDEKRILLVEDNPDDVALTRRALLKNNVANKLDVVEDGEEALEYLFAEGRYAKNGDSPIPCLILLDLKLPKVSGLEVLQKVRESPRTKRIPVVILTTSSEEKDLIESYDLGANSYIRKPVDFKEFLEAVKQLGLYWLVLNESPPLA